VTPHRGAVFLDRDDTIIRDVHYVNDPARVELLPGVADAIRRLNQAGVPVVVITNQSGIARGLITPAQYDAVHARMLELLSAAGARVDATYVCPHHPDFTGPCDCRKPGTLLFRRAAADLSLDLGMSWYIGDKLRDVSPAESLGGTGILVPSASTPAGDLQHATERHRVTRTLDEAVSAVIESRR
jgi:histidinol-phosphate phosphatase family protein